MTNSEFPMVHLLWDDTAPPLVASEDGLGLEIVSKNCWSSPSVLEEIF